MSENFTDTAIDNSTPPLRAHVYLEVLGPYDPVAIAITDPNVDKITDKLDVIDVAQIEAEIYRDTYNGTNIMYMPPFTRGWVSVGSITEQHVNDALMQAGYIDKNADIDDIVDVRAFECKPVEIEYVSPGTLHFRKLK